jgi:hypothetical protein
MTTKINKNPPPAKDGPAGGVNSMKETDVCYHEITAFCNSDPLERPNEVGRAPDRGAARPDRLDAPADARSGFLLGVLE